MKKFFRNEQFNEQFTGYAQIVLGCLIGAASYPLFLTPNHIAPGGLTGIAMIFNYLFDAPVGTVSFLMNIPLFMIGFRAMGRVFVFRSLISATLFSFLIDLLPLPAATIDPLLGAVFGGVILGIAIGLVMRGGATTGGTDMAARMIHKKMPHISVGTTLFAIDCISVLMAGISIQVEYALYSLICIYVSSKAIDMVTTGLSREKACYIISNEHEKIKHIVMHDLERGVTVLRAQGGWSGEERPVLLCVLSAQEVSRVKSIVHAADANAFVFISDAHEVLGEGFGKLAGQ